MGAKKGEHRSLVTEFKKGQHFSPQTEFGKGHPTWSKGKKASPETIEKMRLARLGKPCLKRRRREQKACPICQETFEVGGRAGPRTRIFCSVTCANINRGNESNGFIRKDGYRQIQRNGKKYLEHRFLAEQELGHPLRKGEVVHHINGDKLDNRKENRMVLSRKMHILLMSYLASLWIQEHPDMVNKATRDFEISFAAGG